MLGLKVKPVEKFKFG